MTYRAPWSTKLKLMTSFISIVLLTVSAAAVLDTPQGEFQWMALVAPLGILLFSVFFVVRGYEVRDERLLVRRPGWTTSFSLEGMHDVYFQPGATAGSWRTFGNGGFFGFIGYFRNRILGGYRAYVTDAARTVVIEFEDRTLVVTPDRPEEFVRDLKRHHSV